MGNSSFFFSKKESYTQALFVFDRDIQENPDAEWIPDSLMCRIDILKKLGRSDEATGKNADYRQFPTSTNGAQ